MTTRKLAPVGAVLLALILYGCASTAQHTNTGEQSVAGAPGSGGGGSGGGTGGGTGAGGAAGGAGGGIQSLPSAIPPTSVGTPSMPQEGSKPNPAPSTSSRSAAGTPGADAGTAPEGGPPIPGTAQNGSERGGETAGELRPDGVPNASGLPGGDDIATAPGAPGQAGAENGASDSEVGENGDDGDASEGEAGNVGDEIGASGGGSEETGDDSGQNGTGEALGANEVEAGQNAANIDRGPMTIAERRAAIRGRLDASYAAIDRLTLDERERVRNAAGAETGRGVNGGNGLENGGGAEGTLEGATAIASNIGGTGGATMPRGGATLQGDFNGGTTTASYAIPADIPSGDDDDVVARQLREAATREADPELREKLWDEYREYVGIDRKR
jgi:hypothetical protein